MAVAYGVEVEMEMGGWRDVVEVERKEFRVLRGPPGAGEAGAVAWVAHPRSPLSRDTETWRVEGIPAPSPEGGAEEPTLTVGLESRAVIPGRPLRGTATLDPGDKRARAIEVTLLSQVWGICPTDPRDPAVERRVESALTVTIPEPRRGVAHPFSIDVPPDVPPTWRGKLCGRRWLLLAKADIALGLDVWLEGGVTVL
ncbi:MAG: hypothetical protein HY558_04915 [Euryarchaeota archaeon]|nr:hypothetical protein [Euryarchaeota archaeon]